MEHEVFVPVPAERLREVLDDPARVARAVPGLQQDAGAEPVAGRLKIRVGSHSVTYRGAVRVSRRDDGSYAVEGEAEESRGSGSVGLTLRIVLREAEDGCTVTYDGTASADGRIADLPAEAVEGAVTRLLNRFAEHLATAATSDTDDANDANDANGTDDVNGSDGSGDVNGSDDARAGAGAEEQTPADLGLTEEPPAPERPSAFGSDRPAPSYGPADQEDEDEGDEEDIAEAAHARRTMIGRSAEEVDHAPPRGRYAPVPAPQTVSPPAPLRWAAPAAALAVASAIVAVRALRRRR
ncbi:SRPBCC domain-containing protein [Streptomyces sp. SID5643]|uniref:SRPBCC domain-containing protein n=1 Tax=Streptomyces sp. SID5643 TaxID=2690307 RepID=UPI00136C2C14|nr:SRPBCC domain-containing protein [Streptomyces sp. SID5643]MZF83605.1 carbon monoxide dehydrogenase [Streptomyces sp. SID5643]